MKASQPVDRAALVVLLREAIQEAGTARAWATRHSVSEQFVSDVLAGRRNPSRKILIALGFAPEPRYDRASP